MQAILFMYFLHFKAHGIRLIEQATRTDAGKNIRGHKAVCHLFVPMPIFHLNLHSTTRRFCKIYDCAGVCTNARTFASVVGSKICKYEQISRTAAQVPFGPDVQSDMNSIHHLNLSTQIVTGRQMQATKTRQARQGKRKGKRQEE